MDDDLRGTNERTWRSEDSESGPAWGSSGATAAASRTPEHPSPSAERGAPAGEDGADALSAYLRSISESRVLGRDEQFAIAVELEERREAFLGEAFSHGAIAAVLVSTWRERRDAGHVTGTLSSRHLDADRQDWSPHIDARLSEVERILERRAAVARRKSARSRRELESLDQTLAGALREAGLAFEVVVAAFREADRRGRRGLARARRRLAEHDSTKQTFVGHNLKLVVSFARQYRGMGVPFPDLIQEGNLGLIRAVEKYDPHRGHRFSTYAAWWIHQAMIRAVQKYSRTVRAPSHVYELQLRYKRTEGALRGHNEVEPGRSDVAAALGLSASEVDRLVSTMTPIASTDTPLSEGGSLTLEDALADEQLPDPVESIDRSTIQREMGTVLAGLEPRERLVVECRFGLGGEPQQTLQAVGQRLGLSRERVRQIETQALGRLRSVAGVQRLASALDGRSEA